MRMQVEDAHRGRTKVCQKHIFTFEYYDSKQSNVLLRKYIFFRGMVENLVFLLEKLGFVPNGGRVYYTRGDLHIVKAPNPLFISPTF